MRTTLTMLIGLLLCGNAHPQGTYKVIKVNGQIRYVEKGTNMSRGDVFSEDEDLSFETPNSRAAVINPGKGRFLLTAETHHRGAKSNFLPAMSNISTRGGMMNSLNDLQDQFEGSVAIIDRASWYINPLRFPMNEDHFFYLQFRYNDELINKKLEPREENLILAKSEILKVDEQPIPGFSSPEVILYYYGKEGSRYISQFRLFFPDPARLKDEVSIILDAFPDYTYSQQVNEVSGFVYEFYGKPDKEDVMGFLETAFGIRK